MSQHSSLKMDSVGARHRNVLKRHERVANLRNSDNWGNRESAFKLPKVKLIKMKVKKAKGGKEEAGAEGEAKTATSTTAAEAKPAAKAPAAKAPAAQEKGKAK
jgi:small basic protein (TIGR04137 family)